MGKHDKTEFRWAAPTAEPETISYDPPKDEYYRARITTLEKENKKLREQLEKRAVWYGAGKEAYDEKMSELYEENKRLRKENRMLNRAIGRVIIESVEEEDDII